jgi:anaerobic nitric oxide reductase transcription regulator
MASNLRAIVSAAVELTSRHDRDAVLDGILGELERLVPFDMATVMRLEGNELRVLAGRGFRRDVSLAGLHFTRGQNPRLDRALSAHGTVRFLDPDEADPFDGLADRALDHVHSCMVAPMRFSGDLLGLITADAFEVGRFDAAHEEVIELFAALAAVAIRNADLISELHAARAQLQGQVTTLAEELRDASGTAELVGDSDVMRALREEIRMVGSTNTAVLILGETGTGKELVARALHGASACRNRPLIRFDASALAPSLIESQLFGHVKGAFTGAVSSRPGKFEIADGSTLFLDEVGELPLDVQPRLLRALQEHEIERVGDHTVRRFNVRIIAATNRDLQDEVRAGRFRADLFHRLAVYPLQVPPLRAHTEDLPLLVAHFTRKLMPRLHIKAVNTDPSFLAELAGYSWPGNVRELENMLERALIRSRSRGGDTVRLDASMARALGVGLDRPCSRAAQSVSQGSLREQTERFQLDLMERAITQEDGSVARAANLLGEDRSNFQRRLRRLRKGG